MVTSSQFVQISPEALLEFEYNSKVINTQNSSFLRVINSYSQAFNYLSYSTKNFVKPRLLTNNVLDNTAFQLDDDRWVYLDQDKPITFYESKSDGILHFQYVGDDISNDVDVTYDTVRIHLVSGYNFEDCAGMIIQAAYVEQANGSQASNVVYVANHGYLKESDNIKLNVRPLFLGGRTYDKYIEFCIPSLNDLTNFNSNLQSALLTDSTGTFSQTFKFDNAKLNILIRQIGKYYLEAGQTILKATSLLDNDTKGLLRFEIKPFDDMADVSAVVQESAVGDYFEIYPAFQGEFIEDFLFYRANAFGEQYTVIHDIELFEQISTFGDYVEQMSQKFTFFQDEGFDQPFKYRPVIDNKNCISFTIDYTVRLYNKNTETQIIKRSSLTYPNARKYGRKMQHLNIDSSYQPLRIVNKIVKDDSVAATTTMYNYKNISASSANQNTQPVNNTYTTIETRNICVNSNTLFLESINNLPVYDTTGNVLRTSPELTLSELSKSNIAFGQGDAVLYLTDFDNFVKFKVLKFESPASVQPYSNLISTPNLLFYLVFTDNAGNKVRISQYSDTNSLNFKMTAGEILFKIDSVNSSKILQAYDKTFYITFESKTPVSGTGLQSVGGKTDFETVLYTGKYDTIKNYNVLNDQEFLLKKTAIEKYADYLQSDLTKKVIQYNKDKAQLTANQAAIVK